VHHRRLQGTLPPLVAGMWIGPEHSLFLSYLCWHSMTSGVA